MNNIYTYKDNSLLKVFILYSVLLLLPISELLIIEPKLNDGSLELYSIFILITIIISFFIFFKMNFFKIHQYNFFDTLIPNNILLIISVISFFIFLSFIFQYINSLKDILLFASKYRNGFYKGSGIFTYPILIVIPSILALLIIKQKKLQIGFYISLLLVFIATIIVGLRIFLFPIIFLFLIRILIVSEVKKFIFVSIVLFFVMFLYKYLLNDKVADMSILEIIGYMLGRANYRSLLHFGGFEIGFDDIKCMIYPINQIFFDCNTAQFKEHFLSFNNYKISIGMSFIGLYSGVAISLPKILYNMGSPLFLIFLVLVILLLLYLLHHILKSNSFFLLPLLVNMYIIVTMVLLEGISALNKIIPMVFISFLVTILLWIVNKKYILKRRKTI